MSDPQQNVTINGKNQTLPSNCTLSTMLDQLEVSNRSLAIEVNQELIPHDRFETHQVVEGDQIEIVTFVGGG